MSRVLHINGTVRPDGTPWSEPVVPWSWDGATGRADPGEEVSYASDRKSGVQRLMQRPFSRRGTLWLPASDVGEIGAPLRELARAGLLLESAKTQEISDADGNWDLINDWAVSGAPTRTAGQRGPTGETTGDEQAYLIQAHFDNHRINLALAGLSNINANTYVFSAWARKPDGVTGLVSLQVQAGLVSRVTPTITDRWTRISVPTRSWNTTAATLSLYPGGSTTDGGGPGDAYFWAPQFVLSGAGAGNTARGAGSTIAPKSTRIFSALNASFPWPAVPWTLRCDFTPFFGGGDGLSHTIWEGERGGPGGAGIYQLQKTTGNDLQLLVTERGGGTRTATTAVTWAQRAEQRLVIVSDSSGAINCYLNGTAFSNQLAAPLGLVAAPPDTIEFGGQAATAMDGVMHSFELFDRALDPARLF